MSLRLADDSRQPSRLWRVDGGIDRAADSLLEPPGDAGPASVVPVDVSDELSSRFRMEVEAETESVWGRSIANAKIHATTAALRVKSGLARAVRS